MKLAKVVPIFKAKVKQLLNNYSPMLLQTVVSKILENMSCTLPKKPYFSKTPDIEGLLGFMHPRNTACGRVKYSRIIGINN